MKNYELISMLEKYPAGATVRFCAAVPDFQIEESEPDYSNVNVDITDTDFTGGVISLF